MTTKKKALILLTPGFPKNDDDSNCVTERQLFVKALKVADPFLKIIIISFQYPHIHCHYKWNGIDVYSFNIGYKRNIQKLVGWLNIWTRLELLNNKYSIIGMFSFWLGECAYLGSLFSNRHQIVHYCWLLGQDACEGNKYVRKINPSSKNLIALSDSLADEFFKNYLIQPSYIIPTGTDPLLFDNIPAIRSIDILGVGSLIPLKQYDLFVEVIFELKSQFPKLRVVICGDGPEKGKLQELVTGMGLQSTIELKGELPHAEIIKLMQQTNIFLHTSSYEGYATVISEALCAGAQVVSFCRPMHQIAKQHTIASSKEDMIKIIKSLLKKESDHESIMPYNVHTAAKQALNLLGHKIPTDFFYISSDFFE